MRGRIAFAGVVAVASVLLLAAALWTARRGWRLRHDEPAAPASSALALVQGAAAHGEFQRPLVDPMAGLNLSLMTSDAAGPEAPTDGHILAVNLLLRQLRVGLIRRARIMNRLVSAARRGPQPERLKQVVAEALGPKVGRE